MRIRKATMDNPVQKLFADKQYCFDEMIRIREAWGNKNTFNKNTIDAIRKTLSMMILYCPKEIRYTVEGMFEELERREKYLLTGA